jgi:hypothetical protein
MAKAQGIGAERRRVHARRVGQHIAAPDPFALLQVVERRREIADDGAVIRHAYAYRLKQVIGSTQQEVRQGKPKLCPKPSSTLVMRFPPSVARLH